MQGNDTFQYSSRKLSSLMKRGDTLEFYSHLNDLDVNDAQTRKYLRQLLVDCLDRDSYAFSMEIMIRMRKADSVITLDSQTLDRMCQSISRGLAGSGSNPWSGTLGRLMAEAIGSQPQSLTASSMEMIFREGGWRGLGIPEMEEITSLPWYKKQLQLWLESPNARKKLAAILSSPRSQFPAWDQMLELCWGGLPDNRKDQFSSQLGEGLIQIDTQDIGRLTHVASSYHKIRSLGGNVATADWRDWWNTRIGELWKPSRTLALVGILKQAYEFDPQCAPPGLEWRSDLSKKWGLSLARMLHKSPGQMSYSSDESHQKACVAIMDLPVWMSGWGLWNESQERDFETTLSTIRPNWRQAISTLPSIFSSNENRGNDAPYMERVSSWKRRLLARHANRLSVENQRPSDRRLKL